MQSPVAFTRHGPRERPGDQQPASPSEKFADDLRVIRSMHSDTVAHASGCLSMNTSRIFSGKPRLESWLSHGLGTANQNLPGFVVMTDQPIAALIANALA
jgi:hypothetical protein